MNIKKKTYQSLMTTLLFCLIQIAGIDVYAQSDATTDQKGYHPCENGSSLKHAPESTENSPTGIQFERRTGSTASCQRVSFA